MITRKPLIINPSPEEIVAAQELLTATIDMFGKAESREFASQMFIKYPRMGELANQSAHQLGVNPVDVMIANLSYDLLWGTLGCSTVVMATVEQPTVARNMDWFPPGLIARASGVFKTDNGYHAGATGMFGVVTGISNNGFAVILNAAYSGSPNFDGCPMLFLLRDVIDKAKNYDEALDLFIKEPLMSGGLITLVGTYNKQRVVIERSATASVLRYPVGDEPLVATNHFRFLFPPSECDRFEFLTKNASNSDFSLTLLQKVKQSITSQHILIQPRSGMFELFVPTELLEINDEAYNLSDLVGCIM